MRDALTPHNPPASLLNPKPAHARPSIVIKTMRELTADEQTELAQAREIIALKHSLTICRVGYERMKAKLTKRLSHCHTTIAKLKHDRDEARELVRGIPQHVFKH